MHGQFIVVSSTFSAICIRCFLALLRYLAVDKNSKQVNSTKKGTWHHESIRPQERPGIPWKIPWKNTMEKYHGKMSWKNPAEPLNFDFTYSPLDFGYWNEIIIGTLISHDHATKPGSGQSHYDKQVSWSLFSHINAYHSKEA